MIHQIKNHKKKCFVYMINNLYQSTYLCKDSGKMCRPWKNVSTEIIELFLKLLIYNIAIL